MSRFLLLSGSQRQESLNARLLEHIAITLTGRADIDVLKPQEVCLPLFNQDLEDDVAIAAHVRTLHARFMRADGLILASPEYNCLPSPYLTNLIAWVSRLAFTQSAVQNPFRGRPILLCSASTGWSGGAIGLTALRTLLAYLNALVVGEQICLPYAGDAWNGMEFNFDPLFEDHIRSLVDRFVELATGRPSLENR